MANQFDQHQHPSLTSAETVIYTAPTEPKDSGVFIMKMIFSHKDGKDWTTQAYVTIKKQVGDVITNLTENVPIPYGSSFMLSRHFLPAGASIIANTDENSSGRIDVTLELVKYTRLQPDDYSTEV